MADEASGFNSINMTNTRLFELFGQYYNDTASEAEINELRNLMEGLSDDELSAILLKTWNEQDETKSFFDSGLRENLLKTIHAEHAENPKLAQMHDSGERVLLRIYVAAAVLLIASISAFYLLRSNDHKVAYHASKTPTINDVQPGGDKAMLTLADGRQIVLDTASNGALADQGGIKVIKVGGQLSYNDEANSKQVLYNTITTPRGGQYQLELADSSRVWLNAASSLKFPTAFVGKERTVELTGEGYFEVTHNANMPFHVKVNDIDVMVLGTHFNVNSYIDEPTVKTTLLEGKVMVKKSEAHVFLNPGQQAEIKGSQIHIENDIDLDEVMSWKDGIFLLNNTDLPTIMRQISRWYDINIVFEASVPNIKFGGGVSKEQPLSKILETLEPYGLHFELDGKTLRIR